MFRVFVSNRTEVLAEILARQLELQERDAFAAESIVVPSAGLRIWLEHGLAQHFGIAANIAFSFPAHWIWQIIARVTRTTGDVSPLAQERLVWRILRWLQSPTALRTPRLGDYLHRADACMQFELAHRIAAAFERYGSYRPDWLSAWASGTMPSCFRDMPASVDAQWQADCWRQLVQEAAIPEDHPSVTMFHRLEQADNDARVMFGLPQRLAVFVIPALPVVYLNIFKRLSEWIEVSFFVHSPCEHYWFDLETPKQKARRDLRLANRGGASANHEAEGNALLASWGRQTQENIERLLEHAEGDFEEAYSAPESETLLAQLQTAILQGEDLRPDAIVADDSIAIHSAYSLTRELEILQDQLLRRFQSDSSLQPDQILVVSPDLDTAAPYIDGVFGSVAESDPRWIPYRITGIASRTANRFWRNFSALMQLPQGRCEATLLYELLEFPPLARRFDLDQEGLEAIRRWIRETGIYWGLDADHKTALLGTANDARRGTLDAGLQRLFVGFVMPTEGATDYLECLPYDHVEGRLAYILAAFWRYAQTLSAWQRELLTERSLAHWCPLLLGAMDTFYVTAGDEAAEYTELEAAIRELADLASESGADDLIVPAELVRLGIEDRVVQRAPGGSPSGAVCFAPISALRNLPYRVICCLGMNHDAYPSVRTVDECDLMTVVARRGDPDRRRDERNLFLDLLLAARDGFYLSYCGRSIRDNTVLPPSVLVSDLLDYLTNVLTEDGQSREEVRKALLTEHPLPAYSPRYFVGNARLPSFHSEYCTALNAVTGQPMQSSQKAFFSQALTLPANDWRSVSLADLTQFYRHPVRFLLQERLSLHLELRADSFNDEEPFTLDREQKRLVQAAILNNLRLGQDLDTVQRLARLRAEVAGGSAGSVDVALVSAEAYGYSRQLDALLPDGPLDTHHETLMLGDFALTVSLTSLIPQGQLYSQCTKAGAGYLLAAWLQHLGFGASSKADRPKFTQCLAQDTQFYFEPVPEAERILADLLQIYWDGLSRPLPFFPYSAWEYVAGGEKLEKAQSRWSNSSDKFWCESDDPYYRLAFRERFVDVLDREFESLAKRIYGPLASAKKEGVHAAFL